MTDVDDLLTHIATVAITDRVAADNLLWDWIGRDRTGEGEARMRQLAAAAPRLVAEALIRGGWADDHSLWGPDPDQADVPADVQAASRAVARHLNRDPDTAAAIIDAYIARNGLQGIWGLGTAALRMLAAELNDQRRDLAPPRPPNPDHNR